MTASRAISVMAIVAVAMTSACSAEGQKDSKARWAATYVSQCNEAVANNPGLTGYGSTFCACVAEKHVQTFSAVQLYLLSVSMPLRQASQAITSQCALKATMQGEYNRLTGALGAHKDLAVTAYLAPGFVATDIRGRDENSRQMLAAVYSRPRRSLQITTVVSVRTSGKHIAVLRKSVEAVEARAGGKRQTVETLTFFTDAWIDSDGTWLLQRSRADEIDTFVNGKRVSQLKSASPATLLRRQ